jgi:hypothetical protein
MISHAVAGMPGSGSEGEREGAPGGTRARDAMLGDEEGPISPGTAEQPMALLRTVENGRRDDHYSNRLP